MVSTRPALIDISMQKRGSYTYKADVYALGLVLYEMHHPVGSYGEKVKVSVFEIKNGICTFQYIIHS